MRSLLAISVVILVFFMDHSCGTLVEFLSNLPSEISRAFSIAWGSMEEAIKRPVRIIRFGPGGKLKTTTIATKTTIQRTQKTELLPDRQISWQSEQISAVPPSRRVELPLERKPSRKFELTHELKRKLETKPERPIKQQNEQQQKQQQEQQYKQNPAQPPEPQLERPLDWQHKWPPEFKPNPQPEQKLRQTIKINHHELKLEWQSQRTLERNDTVKPASHTQQQPNQQPERQLDHTLSRQIERHSKLLLEITDFRKSHIKPTIPFLEKPRHRLMSNNIMRLFQW